MPSIRHSGFNDTLIDARLLWLTGSAYPAAPSTLFISLLSGVPLSDGTSVTELTPRVAVTYGAPNSPSGDGGWTATRNIRPTAALSFTPAGSASPVVFQAGSAWALWSASSGGNPLYVGSYGWELQQGVATVLPAAQFQVTATEG
jgi:hypothetical protein